MLYKCNDIISMSKNIYKSSLKRLYFKFANCIININNLNPCTFNNVKFYSADIRTIIYNNIYIYITVISIINKIN